MPAEGRTRAGATSRAAAIAGIGETEYVRGTSKSELRLMLESSVLACRDAGVDTSSVDGVIVAWFDNVNPEPSVEDFIAALGISDLGFHSYLHFGGAASAAAIWQAAGAIVAGLASRVIVSTAWNAYSSRGHADGSGEPELGATTPGRYIRRNVDLPAGFSVPTEWYSLHANRWLYETGADPAGFETVALSTRQHAQSNRQAYMRGRQLSAAEYQAAPVLVEPFRLFDICLETDGAASVLVTAADDPAMSAHRSVAIVAGAEGHADSPDNIASRPDILEMGITKAAPRAFELAGMEPWDVDFAEIYDCYTFVVLRQLEEMGFAERGLAPAVVSGGTIAPGGRLPVNTHGGLLSQAHVLGMNHVAEAVKQLRGEAGAGQVDGARRGLVTGYGGHGDGSILILESDG